MLHPLWPTPGLTGLRSRAVEKRIARHRLCLVEQIV